MSKNPELLARNREIAEAIPRLRAADNYHSWAQIAKKFGVTKNVVLGVAHRNGLTDKRSRPVKTRALSDEEPTMVREPSPPRRFIWE